MVCTHSSPSNEPLTSEQAAQITTATSKLRDITKMERIGGRFDASCLGIFSLGFAGVHSNIYGLELEDRLDLMADYQGMVGKAKAAGMILTMVQEGRIAGRAMLFARPLSTGKIANALAASLFSSIFTYPQICDTGIAQTLGPDVLFTMILLVAVVRCFGRLSILLNQGYP